MISLVSSVIIRPAIHINTSIVMTKSSSETHTTVKQEDDICICYKA